MKKIKNIGLIPLGIVVAITIFACSKNFLDKPPLGTLNPQILATEAGVQGLLIGAYSLVDGAGAQGDGFASGASNWIFGGVTSDDAYKGSDPSDVADAAPMEQWVTLTSTNGAIPQKWNLCYAGIQRSNDVLNTLAIAEGITPEKATAIQAQARFLRAFYHFELKKIFNNILPVDETINPQNTATTNSDPTAVWNLIVGDLTFAKDNLPETWGSEVGRANKWAAVCLLAKSYMYQGQQSSALPLLNDAINNGKTAGGVKYALNDNYYSNFNPAQKNSAESVFAAQTSVQDGSSVDWGGSPNGNFGDILNFPYTGGPGACCGFYNPSQDLANAYKTDADGLPLLDNFYTGLWVSNPAGSPYTGTLDPRIDWVMGREGIPYLDWGNHPGAAWIRNPVNDGLFSPKKNVYAAAQKGEYTDVGSAYWGPTELVANNVNIIRFSDVILWRAECEYSSDLTAAMNDVNWVRNRVANHPETWVRKDAGYNDATATYADAGTLADNYAIKPYTSATFTSANALKAIQMERRLELAMEGQRFFDLVRWGIAATTINAYIGREKAARPLKAAANFTAGKNEYMPIPQGSIDNLNADGTIRITQNPGY
jgi:starch-binding outer membrane protein, SusD/RagB family